MAENVSSREVVDRLDIAVETVESHRAAAMRKAGVRTAGQFIRFAVKNNLTRP